MKTENILCKLIKIDVISNQIISQACGFCCRHMYTTAINFDFGRKNKATRLPQKRLGICSTVTKTGNSLQFLQSGVCIVNRMEIGDHLVAGLSLCCYMIVANQTFIRGNFWLLMVLVKILGFRNPSMPKNPNWINWGMHDHEVIAFKVNVHFCKSKLAFDVECCELLNFFYGVLD